MYALLFGWLITRVNALVSPKQDTLSIAILDIYGFEVGLSGTRLGLVFRKLLSETGWGQCVTSLCDHSSDMRHWGAFKLLPQLTSGVRGNLLEERNISR